MRPDRQKARTQNSVRALHSVAVAERVDNTSVNFLGNSAFKYCRGRYYRFPVIIHMKFIMFVIACSVTNNSGKFTVNDFDIYIFV